MGQNPKVFKRSHIDIASTNVNLTVTDSVASNTGQSFVDKIRNRNNFSVWGTTGSNDAAGTTLEADFIDQKSIDTIILTGHNFETYTIEKWNGSSYVAFSEAISESSYASNFSAHEFSSSETTSRIRITISGTQTPDDDKFLAQLLVLEKLESGQFVAPPIIRRFELSTDKKTKSSLSGKAYLREQVGSTSYDLDFRLVQNDSDLTLLEAMHFNSFNGFVFWPSGGSATQFRYNRIGYRLEDLFLMKVASEWNPVWENGIYSNGMNIRSRLVEVI
jgi:hypothetical protein